MKPPYYDSSEDFYYLSPDYYEELFEKFEKEYGSYENWCEADVYNFIEAATGDKPGKIEFNKQLLFIKYTI